MKLQQKPILVTGSHRSGSTWVGRMISQSPLVGYIHEPFNVRHHPGICKAKFDFWFTYICEANALNYQEDLSASLQFQYQLWEELQVLKKPRDIACLLKNYFLFTSHRMSRQKPLMKDPIAFFSAEWLAREFDMDVIVTIRHPAGFVGSLKKANWTFPFSHLLAQPLLIDKHLTEFEPTIREFACQEKDIIDQGILLWNLIHQTILKYQEKYSNWIFIKHENLSQDPLNGFAKIFDRLNLPYSEKIQAKIQEFSGNNNPVENSNLLEIKRDSKSNIKNWQHRLTPSEIERIKVGTANISQKLYSSEDWE